LQIENFQFAIFNLQWDHPDSAKKAGMKTDKNQGAHFGHHKSYSNKSRQSGVTRPASVTSIGGGGGEGGGGGGAGGSPPRSGSGTGSGGGSGGGCGCGGAPASPNAKFAPPPTPGFSSAKAALQTTLMGASLVQFPDTANFYTTYCDVYSNTGHTPPRAQDLRTSSLTILLTAAALEGLRNRGGAGDGYTHIAICDPSTTIDDGYQNNAAPNANAGDYITIPGGQTNNYWFCVFAMVTIIPGLGRRKVLYLDRRGTGSWTTMV
jgi:hypothetical protein